MEILSRIRSFFSALFQRNKLESDMRNELQFHLEAYADDLMANRGLSREEALRQARIDFGSVDKCQENVREARGLRIPGAALHPIGSCGVSQDSGRQTIKCEIDRAL